MVSSGWLEGIRALKSLLTVPVQRSQNRFWDGINMIDSPMMVIPKERERLYSNLPRE